MESFWQRPKVGTHYKSCIKLHGYPIIAPYMDESKRMEMQRLRECANSVERRLRERRERNKRVSSDSGVSGTIGRSSSELSESSHSLSQHNVESALVLARPSLTTSSSSYHEYVNPIFVPPQVFQSFPPLAELQACLNTIENQLSFDTNATPAITPEPKNIDVTNDKDVTCPDESSKVALDASTVSLEGRFITLHDKDSNVCIWDYAGRSTENIPSTNEDQDCSSGICILVDPVHSSKSSILLKDKDSETGFTVWSDSRISAKKSSVTPHDKNSDTEMEAFFLTMKDDSLNTTGSTDLNQYLDVTASSVGSPPRDAIRQQDFSLSALNTTHPESRMTESQHGIKPEQDAAESQHVPTEQDENITGTGHNVTKPEHNMTKSQPIIVPAWNMTESQQDMTESQQDMTESQQGMTGLKLNMTESQTSNAEPKQNMTESPYNITEQVTESQPGVTKPDQKMSEPQQTTTETSDVSTTPCVTVTPSQAKETPSSDRETDSDMSSGYVQFPWVPSSSAASLCVSSPDICLKSPDVRLKSPDVCLKSPDIVLKLGPSISSADITQTTVFFTGSYGSDLQHQESHNADSLCFKVPAEPSRRDIRERNQYLKWKMLSTEQQLNKGSYFDTEPSTKQADVIKSRGSVDASTEHPARREVRTPDSRQLVDALDLPPVPHLLRQNSYTLLDGPSPLIIAHMERSSGRDSPPANGRHWPGGSARKGWDLAHAKEFWSSTDNIHQIFAVPRVPDRKAATASRAHRNVSLLSTATPSPVKKPHFSHSLERLPLRSPKKQKPSSTRRSLFGSCGERSAAASPARRASLGVAAQRASHSSDGSRGIRLDEAPGLKKANVSLDIAADLEKQSKSYSGIQDIKISGPRRGDVLLQSREGSNERQVGETGPGTDIRDIINVQRSHLQHELEKQMALLLERQRADQENMLREFQLQEEKLLAELRRQLCASPGDVAKSRSRPVANGQSVSLTSLSASRADGRLVQSSEVSGSVEERASPERQSMRDDLVVVRNWQVKGDPRSPVREVQSSCHLEVVLPQRLNSLQPPMPPSEDQNQDMTEQRNRRNAVVGRHDSVEVRIVPGINRLESNNNRLAGHDSSNNQLATYGLNNQSESNNNLFASCELNNSNLSNNNRPTSNGSNNQRDTSNYRLASNELNKNRPAIYETSNSQKENVMDSSVKSDNIKVQTARPSETFRPLHQNNQLSPGDLSASSDRLCLPLQRIPDATLLSDNDNEVSSDWTLSLDSSWRGRLSANSRATTRSYRHSYSPEERAAASKIVAAARGYLVRRLMRTNHVQDIVRTIKDVTVAAMELHQEVQDMVKVEDVELSRRLIHQLNASWFDFNDVFFTMTTPERMAIIASDRARSSARIDTSRVVRRRISSATQRSLKRKLDSNSGSHRSSDSPMSRSLTSPRPCSSARHSSARQSSISLSASMECQRPLPPPQPSLPPRKPWR